VLIGDDVNDTQTGEKEWYARLLNASISYTPRKCLNEVLNMEVQASKEKNASAPKVELKPPPSYVRCKFLGPNSKFPIIVNAKLDGA